MGKQPFAFQVTTAAEIDNVKSTLAPMLNAYRNAEWTMLKSLQGCTVEQADLPPPQLKGFRISTAVRCCIDTFVFVLTNPDMISQYDTLLDKLEILDECPQGKLMYTSYKQQILLVAPRDFCTLTGTAVVEEEGARQLGLHDLPSNGGYIFVQNSKSCESALCPPGYGRNTKLVRGTVYFFGYIACSKPKSSSSSSDTPTVEVSNYMCADAGGSIPKWVTTAAVGMYAEKMAKIRELCEGLEKKREGDLGMGQPLGSTDPSGEANGTPSKAVRPRAEAAFNSLSLPTVPGAVSLRHTDIFVKEPTKQIDSRGVEIVIESVDAHPVRKCETSPTPAVAVKVVSQTGCFFPEVKATDREHAPQITPNIIQETEDSGAQVASPSLTHTLSLDNRKGRGTAPSVDAGSKPSLWAYESQAEIQKKYKPVEEGRNPLQSLDGAHICNLGSTCPPSTVPPDYCLSQSGALMKTPPEDSSVVTSTKLGYRDVTFPSPALQRMVGAAAALTTSPGWGNTRILGADCIVEQLRLAPLSGYNPSSCQQTAVRVCVEAPCTLNVVRGILSKVSSLRAMGATLMECADEATEEKPCRVFPLSGCTNAISTTEGSVSWKSSFLRLLSRRPSVQSPTLNPTIHCSGMPLCSKMGEALGLYTTGISAVSYIWGAVDACNGLPLDLHIDSPSAQVLVLGIICTQMLCHGTPLTRVTYVSLMNFDERFSLRQKRQLIQQQELLASRRVLCLKRICVEHYLGASMEMAPVDPAPLLHLLSELHKEICRQSPSLPHSISSADGDVRYGRLEVGMGVPSVFALETTFHCSLERFAGVVNQSGGVPYTLTQSIISSCVVLPSPPGVSIFRLQYPSSGAFLSGMDYVCMAACGFVNDDERSQAGPNESLQDGTTVIHSGNEHPCSAVVHSSTLPVADGEERRATIMSDHTFVPQSLPLGTSSGTNNSLRPSPAGFVISCMNCSTTDCVPTEANCQRGTVYYDGYYVTQSSTDSNHPSICVRRYLSLDVPVSAEEALRDDWVNSGLIKEQVIFFCHLRRALCTF